MYNKNYEDRVKVFPVSFHLEVVTTEPVTYSISDYRVRAGTVRKTVNMVHATIQLLKIQV